MILLLLLAATSNKASTHRNACTASLLVADEAVYKHALCAEQLLHPHPRRRQPLGTNVIRSCEVSFLKGPRDTC